MPATPPTKTDLLLRILRRHQVPMTQAEIWFHAKRLKAMKGSRRSLYGLLLAMVRRGHAVRAKNRFGVFTYQASTAKPSTRTSAAKTTT